jgi:hypothetical protein
MDMAWQVMGEGIRKHFHLQLLPARESQPTDA